MEIAVLCIDDKFSNYLQIPGLDLYGPSRGARSFDRRCPVITHAPCAQWSRMKAFSVHDVEQKDLAWFCLDQVKRNGGIFEHPEGSSFFAEAGIKPTISVDQHWWKFPARKRTWLYFHRCRPIQFPLNLNAIENVVQNMHSRARSITPLVFNLWLIECITRTHA